jgi:hypothetical protein
LAPSDVIRLHSCATPARWLHTSPQVQACSCRAIGTELRDRTCSGEFRLLEMPERTGGAINQDKSKQRYRPLFNTPSRVV